MWADAAGLPSAMLAVESPNGGGIVIHIDRAAVDVDRAVAQHAAYGAALASLDRSTIASGQTAKLTITLRKQPPRQVLIVGIASILQAHIHDIWPLAVVTR